MCFLPVQIELTESTEKEVFAQVQSLAGARAASGSTQPDFGPGHHLRLPKRATRKTFVRTGQGLQHTAAEITLQNISVHRALIGTDKLQDLRLHYVGTLRSV